MNKDNTVMVSILCTVFNHGKYLRQCLDGIVNQKTSFAYEAIVHDDVSTDNSAEIIREYAEKYPHIIKPIFQKENQYSKADGPLWRAIYGPATGKYISYCEGDDYWIDENKLQTQVDILESNADYSASTHNQIVVDDDSVPYPGSIQNIYRENTDRVIDIQYLFDHCKVAHTASFLFRHSLIKDMTPNQWEEFTKLRVNGDMLLSALFLTHGKVFHIAKDMACYRYVTCGNDSWSSQNARKNICLSTCIQLEDIRLLMKKHYGAEIDYTGHYKSRAYYAIIEFIKRPCQNNYVIMKETANLANYVIWEFMRDLSLHIYKKLICK